MNKNLGLMIKELQNAQESNSSVVVPDSTQEKNRRASRTSKGLRWLLIGALMGFLSCLCSICNPIASLYYVNLYGISSLAVLIAFYGLYLIFE